MIAIAIVTVVVVLLIRQLRKGSCGGCNICKKRERDREDFGCNSDRPLKK
jgi:hypothetical protein